jgi:secernin
MCDTLVVVGNGFVGFAKNSDRDPNEAQRLEWISAAEHSTPSTVRCTWKSIPQVPRTRALLISRPFWMWGAEMGSNDAGLVVGNEAVFTNQPFDDPGLTGMDLVRLALERSACVEEGIAVISDLIKAHGQGGRCGYSSPSFRYHNSFLLADAKKAAVVEAAGRKIAVEIVRQGVRAISNGLTLPEMQGFASRLKGSVAECKLRRATMEGLGVRVESARDLAAALREHGDRTGGSGSGTSTPPHYRRLNGALSSPCVHFGGWLAGSQTVASWISILRPDRAEHWATGTSAPCISLFRPVSLECARRTGAPEGYPDSDSLWWRFERLHRSILRDWKASALMRAQRDEIEQTCFGFPGDQDACWNAAERWLDSWRDRFDQLEDLRPRWLRNRWKSVDAEAAAGNRLPSRSAI